MSSAQNSKGLLYAIANDKVFTGGNYDNYDNNNNNYPVSSGSGKKPAEKPAGNPSLVVRGGKYPINSIWGDIKDN